MEDTSEDWFPGPDKEGMPNFLICKEHIVFARFPQALCFFCAREKRKVSGDFRQPANDT